MNIVRTRAPLSLERQKGARTREPRVPVSALDRANIDRWGFLSTLFQQKDFCLNFLIWVNQRDRWARSRGKGGLSDLRGSLEIVEIFRYEREFSYGWIDYWFVDHGRIGNVIVGKGFDRVKIEVRSIGKVRLDIYNNQERIDNVMERVLISDLWSLSFEENLPFDWIFLWLDVQYASL